MNESELLGPCAWGAPSALAQLKGRPEDFQVEEVLSFAQTGEGEHLWLWVEKRDIATDEAAQRIAKACGVPLCSIGYSGLKDKRALTRQWFSIHLPGRADPDLSLVQGEGLAVLRAARHQRKLQRGAHAGNRFRILLTSLEADDRMLEERLGCIATSGVPNYFGQQRFGFDGSNIAQAQASAASGLLPRQRARRSRLLSAARSLLFNRVLARRVMEGSWDRSKPGDLLSFADSRSFFPALQTQEEMQRLKMLELHPTGPLWGQGQCGTTACVGQLEREVAAGFTTLTGWLEAAGLRQERRILRLPVKDLSWSRPQQEVLLLDFMLPAGCFATAVVRELAMLRP